MLYGLGMSDINNSSQEPQKAVYSLSEASKLLGCDSRTLKTALGKEGFPISSIVIGRQTKVVKKSLNDYLGISAPEGGQNRG